MEHRHRNRSERIAFKVRVHFLPGRVKSVVGQTVNHEPLSRDMSATNHSRDYDAVKTLSLSRAVNLFLETNSKAKQHMKGWALHISYLY